MSTALQTAGLLSALIFLINSIFEVITINGLYSSQSFLISLLLGILGVWALLEVVLIRRRLRLQALHWLTLMLALQLGVIAARHWQNLSQRPAASVPLSTPITVPDLGQGLLFLPLYLLIFLAISRCLIDAFAAGERLRANQLQQQMLLLRQAEDELKAAYAHQQQVEEQQRADLEQKLKTSLTAAAVVHEIQQPLSAILLNCNSANHWLKQLPPRTLPSQLLHSLDQLGRNGEQVVATMERMRMLLRNVETTHTAINLCINIDSGLLFLKQDIERQQVRLWLEGLDEPCAMNGDGAQLQMALVNLIRNALQAMQAQPPETRQLLVQLTRQDEQVALLVADSGPGFAAGYDNDTSWELLKSTKASGMGIGLFIAQTAAANHHGRLRLGRSARLGGAEVVLELPLKPSPR